MENIIPLQKAEDLGQQLKQEGKRIVLVGGCFDLLHFGHITLLEEAKKQGDVLVVLLESNERIRMLKGTERPLHTQEQRAHMLTSLTSVDYVVLLPANSNDTTYNEVVKMLQPAIIATTQGSDSLRYIEKQAKDNNAQIYLATKIENLSTSRILDVVAKEL